MGFLNTATTITITAKLTRNGRERMLKETNTIFSHFVIGDSDANYRTSESLPTGTIVDLPLMMYYWQLSIMMNMGI